MVSLSVFKFFFCFVLFDLFLDCFTVNFDINCENIILPLFHPATNHHYFHSILTWLFRKYYSYEQSISSCRGHCKPCRSPITNKIRTETKQIQSRSIHSPISVRLLDSFVRNSKTKDKRMTTPPPFSGRQEQ